MLPSTPRSSELYLSFRFPHQNPVDTSSLPHTCYVRRLSHSCTFVHPNNIGWGVQIIKFLIMYFSPLPCYLVPLGQIFSLAHYSRTSSAYVPPSMRATMFHTHTKGTQPLKTIITCDDKIFWKWVLFPSFGIVCSSRVDSTTETEGMTSFCIEKEGQSAFLSHTPPDSIALCSIHFV